MKFTDKIDELAAALAAFQAEVKNPANVATNPFLKNKYAPLSEVLNALRPIAAKHGLSIVQEPVVSEGNVSITTYIFHSSGQFMVSSPIIIPMGGKGTAQEIGAAITYGRRYAISALLGVSSEDDDDANSISEQPTQHQPQPPQRQLNSNKSDVISEAQRKRMFAIAKGNEQLLKGILSAFGYEHSADVTKADYEKICGEVEAAVKGEE
jgi:hypothetical protein